jgi:hypothetical protein
VPPVQIEAIEAVAASTNAAERDTIDAMQRECGVAPRGAAALALQMINPDYCRTQSAEDRKTSEHE